MGRAKPPRNSKSASAPRRLPGSTQAASRLKSPQDAKAERSRVEEAPRRSDQWYLSLYTKTPAMLHSIGTDGCLVAVSDRWLEAFGYERDEVIGRKSLEFLTEESKRYAETVTLPEFWETGYARDVPFQFVRKNGEIVDVLLSAVVEYDSEGSVLRSLAALMDVTERKRAEETLRQSEERFRVSLMHTPVVVFQQDMKLRYTWIYNPGPGSTVESILGKTDAELLSPEYAAHFTQLKRQVLASGVGTRQEIQATVSGHIVWHDLTVEPLRDDTGEVVGVTGASFDITERKRTEEALQHAREELEGRVERHLTKAGSHGLTFRELTVLHLVAEGKSDKEIAIELGISQLTVSKHVANILAKMNAESRTEAGVRAVREGLIG